MKEIKIKNFRAWQDIREDSRTIEIDSIRQDCNQYDNLGVYIYRLPGSGIVMIEDCITHSNEYLLEENDSLVAADYANNWADNSDADSRIEMIAWGLSSADDYAVADDYDGECKIICVKSYYDHSPVEYVVDTDDDYAYDGVIFANREAAQEWIDDQEDGTYYLSHNEAGCPAYTIVEA